MRAKKRIIKKRTVKKYNNEIIEKEKEGTESMSNNEESDNKNLGEKEQKKWLEEEVENKRLEEEAEKELYQMNSKEIPIGIDFGTTNSCIVAFKFESVEIISNQITGRTTPSVFSFCDKEIAVGEQQRINYMMILKK